MPAALPSIKRLLASVVLVSVVPVALLFFAALAWFQHEQRSAQIGNTVAMAHALMSGVDEKLHSVAVGIARLSQSDALSEGDLAAFEAEALAMSKALPLRNVVLIDAEGRQIANTRAATRDGQPAEVHPRATELLAANEPRVLDLFRTQVERRFAVGMGIATHVQGRGGYAIVATIDPAELESTLLREKLPPSWIAAVLDRQGVIVGRSRDHDRYVGTPAREALIARIREVPEDAVESVTVDGVPVITAFSRSPTSGWSIVIGIPRADLIAPLQATLIALGAGSAIVLAVTLAFARRIARRISASLEALAAAARSVGHRAKLDLPPPAFAEADQLGQSLLHADTAMHDAQNERARTEAALEAVMDSVEDALVVLDENDRIVWLNRPAMRMFGASEDDARGQPVGRVLPDGARFPAGAPAIVQARRWNGQRFTARVRVTVTHAGDRTARTLALKEHAREPSRGQLRTVS